MTCPKCGSTNCDRDEVDIGVGTQCGPWACFDCGWSESRRVTELLPEEIKCESGHTWTNQFGDDWKPEPGTPCDCGMRKWGESEHGA